jgi:hypothetical protein
MIFGLRDKPDQGGDVYSFSLDIAKLSSVQIEIIRKWVRDGQNILFWGQKEARKYDYLFADVIRYYAHDASDYSKSNHPVNSDVIDVRFFHSDSWNRAALMKYPPDTEVIVSNNKGVVAGRVPYGRGNIYFSLFGDEWPMGRDRDRWTLNFYHWMLGFAVPGTTEIRPASPSPPVVGKRQEPQDRILLKNGETVSGRLTIDGFTVKTSYADLSFELKQVENVVLEGAGQNIEMLILKAGDKLSGIVGPNIIRIKLESGQEVQIEKDKIEEIVLQE